MSSEQPTPTPSVSQLLAEVTVENQALRRRAERAEAAFAGAFEKGMLRQLERQLHEEQNPGRSVTLGPALADSATGPLPADTALRDALDRLFDAASVEEEDWSPQTHDELVAALNQAGAALAATPSSSAATGPVDVELLRFRDPDGSGFCPRCRFPIAVHPLDEHGMDVDRCPDQPSRPFSPPRAAGQ